MTGQRATVSHFYTFFSRSLVLISGLACSCEGIFWTETVNSNGAMAPDGGCRPVRIDGSQQLHSAYVHLGPPIAHEATQTSRRAPNQTSDPLESLIWIVQKPSGTPIAFNAAHSSWLFPLWKHCSTFQDGVDAIEAQKVHNKAQFTPCVHR